MEFVIKYWVEVVFGIVCGIFGFLFRFLNKKVKKQIEKQRAIENGVQALLRDRLIDRYDQCMKKGELSILDRENLNHMFDEYKNLGGNGTVEQLISDLLELPTKYAN